jgi:hypothetical protein
MIPYKQIIRELETEVLSHTELAALKNLEEFTDSEIENQMVNSNHVSISEADVYSITKGMPDRRRAIVIRQWSDLYRNGGWCVKLDYEDSAYTLSGHN